MIKPKSISYQIPQQMFLIEAVPSWMHVIMWGVRIPTHGDRSITFMPITQ